MSAPEPAESRGKRAIVVAGVAAVIGIVGMVVGAIVDPRQSIFAYLAAYNYVITTVLGALVFLMTCHAMRAAWPTLLRRLVEGIVVTLPLLAVLFIPILFGLHALYPWLRPATIADERTRNLVAMKAPYLNLGWFVGRAAVFFAVWIFTGFWLRRWSLASDRGAGAVVNDRMFAMSGVLLPFVALALSFAGFDWVMSLDPTWASTMFPVYYFAGGFVASLALLTVLTWIADRAGLIAGINQSHYYALGRLLLSFVVFWAYTAYFQLMLMWIADKPDEVTFYLKRIHGGWAVVSVILLLGQFVFPFFALLSYDLKQRPGPLAAVAVWILVAHYVDVHWLVMPDARPEGRPYRVIDLFALLAVGGVTVVYGVLRQRGVPQVPIHDPALPRALHYDSR